MDLSSARSALQRHVRGKVALRAEAAHPYRSPTPGHTSLPRRDYVTVSQLRAGASPLTRDTLRRIGLSDTESCPGCGEPDSICHLLTDCPVYQTTRGRLWGPLPTLEEIFAEPATKIIEFLQKVGRTNMSFRPPPRRPS